MIVISIISFAFVIAYLACFWFSHSLDSDLFAGHAGVLGISIFPLLACVIQQFADWMRIFLIDAKMYYNLMIYSETTVLPFVHFRMSTLFAALYTAMTASDLVTVVKFWFFIDSAYEFAVLTVVVIVSGIIWRSVTNRIVKLD
jgi:hypothetical protein